MPPNAIAALRQLSKPSQISAVILRGVSDLAAPPTPTSGLADDAMLAPHDILLAGAVRHAGTQPVAFAFENSGRLARNVVSNPAQRGKASSHGFDVPLYYHQDNCGQPFKREVLVGCKLPPMPEQLAFLAIRNDERVPTRILLVDDALSELSAPTLKILAGPYYRIGAPDSVASDGFEATCIQDAPILSSEEGFKVMRYDPLLVTTKDPAAMLAHARLAIALEEKASYGIDIILEAGDIMIFKNQRLLHMRVAFQPLDAPRSRWLRRFYGRSSE